MSTEPMFTAAMYGSAEAAREAEVKWLRAENEALSKVLDTYEAQTKALPGQHEIPERGCSTYNWRMACIRDLRSMIDAARAAREG